MKKKVEDILRPMVRKILKEAKIIPSHIVSGAVEKCIKTIDEAVHSDNDQEIVVAIIKYLNEKYLKGQS